MKWIKCDTHYVWFDEKEIMNMKYANIFLGWNLVCGRFVLTVYEYMDTKHD
jgi:hypothetical protein